MTAVVKDQTSVKILSPPCNWTPSFPFMESETSSRITKSPFTKAFKSEDQTAVVFQKINKVFVAMVKLYLITVNGI